MLAAGHEDVSNKIKTLRKSIQEISGDGKLMPMPTQEEHILYENSMYVCTHVFGTASGARVTEVYLWAGVSVAESAIEDAQLFGKRVAKEAGAGPRSTPVLQLVRQTREPPNFFQALGGIVVVRKGSRVDAATRPYMLCGRPHLGHIAFDEVDLGLSSYTSGFPHIVATSASPQDTRMYLWKGSSCSAEAVGSARLIGMDLNPAGDIIEIDEGAEPSHFLDLFHTENRASSPLQRSAATSTLTFSERAVPRLFRITAQPARQSSSSFSWATSLLTRRPSWPARRPSHRDDRSPTRPGSSASNKSGTVTSPTAQGNSNADAAAPTSATGTIKISCTELTTAPGLAQSSFEPDGVYVLDCVTAVYVLPGPLVSSPTITTASTNANPSTTTASTNSSPSMSAKDAAAANPYWQVAFTQALLFAQTYARLVAELDDRPEAINAEVLLTVALPEDARRWFRMWDSRRGIWGTGGLMAGRISGDGNADGIADAGASDYRAEAGRVNVSEAVEICCVRSWSPK